MTWNSAKQTNFENHIICVTTSAGLPLAWVDNLETIDMFNDFAPTARVPSQKMLTCHLLPAAVNEFRANSQAATAGYEVTIHADRWTGQNKHHLIAIMMMVDGTASQVPAKSTSNWESH